MSLADDVRRGRTTLPTGWLRRARRDDRGGRRARLAILIATEARYRDGVYAVGRYDVRLTRGQTIITNPLILDVLGIKKRQAARRALESICAALGWRVEPLTTGDHRVLLGTDPGTPEGTHPGTPKGTHVGTLVTICNYEELQGNGTPKGTPKGTHLCTPEGTDPGTPIPFPIPSNPSRTQDQDPLSTSAKPKPDTEPGFTELLAEVNRVLNKKLRKTPAKLRAYRARLKTFDHADLMKVPTGAKFHPDYNGSKGNPTYYDWDNLFRNDERVEKLIDAADNPQLSPEEMAKYDPDYLDWEWQDYAEEGMTAEHWRKYGPPPGPRGAPRIPKKYEKLPEGYTP